MRVFQFWIWMLFLFAGASGSVFVAVKEWNRMSSLPGEPVVLTLAELASTKDLPQWIELRNAVPLCDHRQVVRDHDVVPVVDGHEMGLNPEGPVVLISLENHEFCAELGTPLRLAPLRRSGYVRALLGASTWPHPVMHNDVFELSADPISSVRTNTWVMFSVAIICFGGIVWLWRRRPESNRKTINRSLSKNGRVAAMLFVAITFAGFSFWGGLGVANDMRAWYRGVDVKAELKGSSTTSHLFILSILRVKVVYSMPGEDEHRTQSRMFMTIFRVGRDLGRVRALPADPDVVTFEEAIKLLPFRVPLLLMGLVAGIWLLRQGLKLRRAP